MDEMVVRVALPTPMRRCFDYLLTDDCLLSAQQSQAPLPDSSLLGCRVKVPFGSRELVGVIAETNVSSDYDRKKLKSVLAVLDAVPLLDLPLIALLRWAAKYYHHALGEVFMAALPVLLRKGHAATLPLVRVWRLIQPEFAETQRQSLSRARKQQQLFQFLLEQPSKSYTDEEIKAQGFSVELCKALQNKKLLLAEKREALAGERQAVSEKLQVVDADAVLDATDEQRVAIDRIVSSLDGFQCTLLEGVTGSGKTEVYLQVLAPIMAAGKQALILVPEIGLTPQTLARFSARFAVKAVCFHSNLSDQERMVAWLQAARGDAQLIIGTRSAVFTPLPKLGVIIIDEEHDASFKQMDGFRYSARDVAIARAKELGISIVLGSATPSLESYRNVLLGRYAHAFLSIRPGSRPVPPIELLDIRGLPLYQGFSEPLLETMKQHLAQGQQVLVFLNRRGYAPWLLCHSCGWGADCPHCSARMTLHHSPARLHCHHCDHREPIPRVCPQCSSREIEATGMGTERSEQVLADYFPETPIMRIDRDSTRSKKRMMSMFNEIQQGQPCILVGTQLLAKGHHFPQVTLVAIIDADGGLFSADFRGLERMAQLLVQVAGRSGRGHLPGRVIMQTHYADNPEIQCFAKEGYRRFALELLKQREDNALPPAHYLAVLRADATSPDKPIQWLQGVRQWLDYQRPPVKMLGPLPAMMEKRAGRFRYQIHFYSAHRSHLHQLLSRLIVEFEKQKVPSGMRWGVDIDPLDFN